MRIRTLLAAFLFVPSLSAAQVVPYSAPLADYTMQVAVPTTGTTVNIAQTTAREIIAPSGSLLALTINLPTCSSTYGGQIVRFSSTQAVTTVTMTSVAGTIVSTLTGIIGGGFAEYTCYGTTSTWYRTG